MKDNGDIVEFLKQKDYVMVNNNLGAGSFGKTVLLKDPFIDELFVAKKYEPYYEEYKKEFYDSFLQEIKIMYKLNHRNIIRIYNYYAYESVYCGYILMEYIDGQNIADYFDIYPIFTGKDDPDPDEVFSQLIDGFCYIESQGIIHRDIREGNILIDKSGTVKIIDFGLGKTFKPVYSSADSLVDVINRSGLDKLPEEYFKGTYTSRTDMFYLAELFNRLLKKAEIEDMFTYQPILEKMMESQEEKRFESFVEIKDAIGKRDFSSLDISEHDKEIYQNFSNAMYACIACYTKDREFVTSIDDFVDRLNNVIRKNCFEDTIQNNCDFVYTLVKKGFKFYGGKPVWCSSVIEFRDWFSNLNNDSKILVFNNIIAKISLIATEEPEDELPF